MTRRPLLPLPTAMFACLPGDIRIIYVHSTSDPENVASTPHSWKLGPVSVPEMMLLP